MGDQDWKEICKHLFEAYNKVLEDHSQVVEVITCKGIIRFQSLENSSTKVLVEVKQ
jgi:hypothetical protein